MLHADFISNHALPVKTVIYRFSYNNELKDDRKINLLANFTAAEREHFENMKAERNYRSAKLRSEVTAETWKDSVNLSLQARVTEEIVAPIKSSRMDVTGETAAAVEAAVSGESGHREATEAAAAPAAASDQFACPSSATIRWRRLISGSGQCTT